MYLKLIHPKKKFFITLNKILLEHKKIYTYIYICIHVYFSFLMKVYNIFLKQI